MEAIHLWFIFEKAIKSNENGSIEKARFDTGQIQYMCLNRGTLVLLFLFTNGPNPENFI